MDIENAKALLEAADVFFGFDEEWPDGKWERTINLNDTFYWACCDGVVVEDEEMPRVAELFFRYGWCGILYWVAVEKRGGEKPEFLDVQRHIEFVRQEEKLRQEVPSASKRAYTKLEYTLTCDRLTP